MRKQYPHGHAHRGAFSRTYLVWQGMHQRCSQKSEKRRRYYDRGIRVLPAWKDFNAFLTDMGERPYGLTLERIDNESGYSPGNCRWASRKEQARNRTTNVVLTLDGVTASVAEWAERTGINYGTIMSRIRMGWADHDVIHRPIGPNRGKGCNT